MHYIYLFYKLKNILNLMKTGTDKNYDLMVKVLIIGDSGVGKTNVLMRLCDNNFMPSHLMTIGFWNNFRN